MSKFLVVALAALLVPSSAYAFSYATGGCATGGCAAAETFLDTNANEIDTALDALEARDTVVEHESLETINVILETEMDASSELRALIDDESGTGAILFAGGAIGAATADTALADDNDTSVATTAFVQTELTDLLAGAAVVLDTDIGVTVQALDADLTDLADGSLSGSKIGTGLDATTITTGTIGSTARLPAAVIETTEIDTVAELNAIITDSDLVSIDGVFDLDITGSASFSGTIQGYVPSATVSATTHNPVGADLRGGVFFCSNAAGCDVTLPTAVAGYNACWYDYNGGGVITLDANAGDAIVLDGVTQTTADAIDSAGARGDFICLLALDATYWITLGRSGTFIPGGPE